MAHTLQTPPGRMFFLTPRPSNAIKPEEGLEYPLAKVQVFSEHKDTIRRGGVASVMKCVPAQNDSSVCIMNGTLCQELYL